MGQGPRGSTGLRLRRCARCASAAGQHVGPRGGRGDAPSLQLQRTCRHLSGCVGGRRHCPSLADPESLNWARGRRKGRFQEEQHTTGQTSHENQLWPPAGGDTASLPAFQLRGDGPTRPHGQTSTLPGKCTFTEHISFRTDSGRRVHT